MNRTNEIETVAAELGYTESMGCSALDYIIETAKASVMINQKNVELVAQAVVLQECVIEAAEQLWNAIGGHAKYITIEEVRRVQKVAEKTPNQCLNQIKAEAVLKFSARLLVNHKVDIIDFAKQLADELSQGGEL